MQTFLEYNEILRFEKLRTLEVGELYIKHIWNNLIKLRLYVLWGKKTKYTAI
jgi:hypothetical protein